MYNGPEPKITNATKPNIGPGPCYDDFTASELPVREHCEQDCGKKGIHGKNNYTGGAAGAPPPP